MNSFKSQPIRRAATTICRSCSQLRASQRALSIQAIPSSNAVKTSPATLRTYKTQSYPSIQAIQYARRSYATPAADTSSLSANELLEQLQDQYATARDEFEIATEETEKKTVYAADDREAARKELDTLKEMFEDALKGQHGEEVKSRVGSRVRELESALIALEESALED